MKKLEQEYKQYLPAKSYAVIRVDGKGFSKYTARLEKPFDWEFTKDMRRTARYLVENIDGAICAYTQSDEISVIFSDLGGPNTQWWFGGQTQKIVSITAALATAKFNSLRSDVNGPLALFDSRVHHLNGEEGVLEYLKWRQADAIKNSVGMLASHHFSHKQLTGVPTDERIVRLASYNVIWRYLPDRFRYGSLVSKHEEPGVSEFERNGQMQRVEHVRKVWLVGDAPLFSSCDQLGVGFPRVAV